MMKENPMRVKPVLPLLMSMALPPMLSMLIQSMYNIIDSIFVAKLGENALTAVSLAFPLQNLVLAVAVGMGVAMSASIARGLGAHNQDEINGAAVHGLIYTGLHALIFVLLGMFATKPFIAMFTDNDEILKMGCEYSYIVICFSFGCLFHIAIEKMFQATGNMIIPMFIQVIGAIVNIILDPILIFGLLGMPKLGVQGAAIATVIGQISACLLSVCYFMHNNGGIKIKLKGFRFDKHITKRLYAVAIPSSIMVAFPSLLVTILNGLLSSVSQTAVAVLGLYFKIQSFVFLPASGVVQGMRPIVSYNYGAGLLIRMKKVMKVSLLVVGTIMIVGTLLFVSFPKQIMQLFSAGNEMISMGVPALRIIGISFMFSTFGIIYAGGFEALGKGGSSLIISLLRQLLIIPILSLLFIKPFGLYGVWVTFPIAEIIASIVAIYMMRKTLANINANH